MVDKEWGNSPTVTRCSLSAQQLHLTPVAALGSGSAAAVCSLLLSAAFGWLPARQTSLRELHWGSLSAQKRMECQAQGRTTISTNQTPQGSQGLNHQPKSTHGGTCGSSCICNRGWPCQTSTGGEALGPVEIFLASRERPRSIFESKNKNKKTWPRASSLVNPAVLPGE
uniref:uncharacterized protein LOC143313154 n=1 Tax=Arvicanthis niloticus TaxID=61156 RepID=UPI00402B7EF4